MHISRHRHLKNVVRMGKNLAYTVKRVPLTKNRWRASFVACNKLNAAHFALCSALEQSRVFRLGDFDCLSQP